MAGEYLKSSVHVHSKLCDGKNTLDEIAVTAWRNGLQTLGFSGHSHTPCDLEYCMTQSRTALYKAQVAKLKERYAGKLDILCGLEWDLFSDDDPTQYGARRICAPASTTILTAMRWPWSRPILPMWPRLPRKSPRSWVTST